MLQHRKVLNMNIEHLEKREAALKEMTLSAKDFELRKKFHQELMAIQEEIKQIREELKILETPIQQMLPDIFEEKRAVPNSFLRGALFGMVKKGKRTLVKDEKIFSMSQYDISFSGEYLDQNDLELWDTLIYLAKQHKVEKELRITLYELCKAMKLTPTNTSYEALLKRIQRLQFGQVKIIKNTKEIGGSLLNNYYIDKDGDGKLVIEYNRVFSHLFIDNDYTLISIDVRHALGDNQLARWLYNFYETHQAPIPFTIEFLKKLCRSESELKDFKYKLKKALHLIKESFLSFNAKSQWDYEIINDQLFIYKSGKFDNSTKNQPKLL